MIYKKRRFILLCLCLLAILFCIAYSYIENSSAVSKNLNEAYRSIGSTPQKWLNGYLGIFFRFKHVGIMNWMLIPLLFVWAKKRKFERWTWALFSVYVLTFMIIAGKGYDNVRYHLTLYPLTMTAILIIAWDAVADRFGGNPEKGGVALYAACFAVLIGANFFFQRNLYVQAASILSSRHLNALPMEIKGELKDPTKFSDGAILICDQPWFYYHTDRRGLDFTDRCLEEFYSSQSNEEAWQALKRLNVKYMLWDSSFERTYRGINVYRKIMGVIRDHATLILPDGATRLYRLTDVPDHLRPDKIQDAIKYSFIQNGQFKKWQGGKVLSWNTSARIEPEQEQYNGFPCLKMTGDNFNLSQRIYIPEDLDIRKLTCFVWMKTSVPDKYRILIYDGYNSSSSERHNGDGNWQMLRASHEINPRAQFVDICAVQAEASGNKGDVLKVSNALTVEGLYFSFHDFLCAKKLKPDSTLKSILVDGVPSPTDKKWGPGTRSIFKSNKIQNGLFENWMNEASKHPEFWQGASTIQRMGSAAGNRPHIALILGDNYNFSQEIRASEFKTGQVTCFAWIKTSVPDKYRVQVYDGYSSSESFHHSGDDRWHVLRAIHKIHQKSKTIDIRAVQAARTGRADSVHVGGVLVLDGSHLRVPISTPDLSVNQHKTLNELNR